jgi:hypothetical protein
LQRGAFDGVLPFTTSKARNFTVIRSPETLTAPGDQHLGVDRAPVFEGDAAVKAGDAADMGIFGDVRGRSRCPPGPTPPRG